METQYFHLAQATVLPNVVSGTNLSRVHEFTTFVSKLSSNVPRKTVERLIDLAAHDIWHPGSHCVHTSQM